MMGLTINQLAKKLGVKLVKTAVPANYGRDNGATMWGSLAPCPKRAQAFVRDRRGRVTKIVAHTGLNQDTAEPILHELAHVAFDNYAEDDTIEQEIAWLDQLQPKHAAWVRQGLIDGIPQWGVWSETIREWHWMETR